MRAYLRNRAGIIQLGFDQPEYAPTLAALGLVLRIMPRLDDQVASLADTDAAPPSNPEPFRVLTLCFSPRRVAGEPPAFDLVPATDGDDALLAEMLPELQRFPTTFAEAAEREIALDQRLYLANSILSAMRAYR